MKTLAVKTIFLISFFYLGQFNGNCQFKHQYHANLRKYDTASLGLGAGLDYGGLGINGTFYPKKYLGFFLGLGYNFLGFGYNGGVKIRFTTKTEYTKTITPYLLAMYGFNGVIKTPDIPGASVIVYDGPTFGIGFDTRYSKGYWSFGILIPIRPNYINDYNDLKSHGVTFNTSVLPIWITAGYKFILN
jgi:hypothetical protein